MKGWSLLLRGGRLVPVSGREAISVQLHRARAAQVPIGPLGEERSASAAGNETTVPPGSQAGPGRAGATQQPFSARPFQLACAEAGGGREKSMAEQEPEPLRLKRLHGGFFAVPAAHRVSGLRLPGRPSRSPAQPSFPAPGRLGWCSPRSPAGRRCCICSPPTTPRPKRQRRPSFSPALLSAGKMPERQGV